MAAETQQEPKRFNPFASDEDTDTSRRTKKTSAKKPAKPLRPAQVIVGIFACAAALAAGRFLRYDTTLFMEHRTLKGYLPVEEYVLNYSDTGEPTQNVRSFHLNSYSVYDINSNYETSRGIQTGDSWDEFVEAYGDETIYYIYTHRYTEEGRIDWDYDSPYFDQTYTVREFDEKVVKTGQIDITKDDIQIEFNVETDGMKVLYSEDEKSNYYHHYMDSHPLSGWPDLRSIYLEFTFTPEIASGRPGLTLDTIYQSTYR